ncbi:MAG: hypothetical protein GY861_16190 [bacterium]|nr:hypothetical protein [bacterium]
MYNAINSLYHTIKDHPRETVLVGLTALAIGTSGCKATDPVHYNFTIDELLQESIMNHGDHVIVEGYPYVSIEVSADGTEQEVMGIKTWDSRKKVTIERGERKGSILNCNSVEGDYGAAKEAFKNEATDGDKQQVTVIGTYLGSDGISSDRIEATSMIIESDYYPMFKKD